MSQLKSSVTILTQVAGTKVPATQVLLPTHAFGYALSWQHNRDVGDAVPYDSLTNQLECSGTSIGADIHAVTKVTAFFFVNFAIYKNYIDK